MEKEIILFYLVFVVKRDICPSFYLITTKLNIDFDYIEHRTQPPKVARDVCIHAS